MNLNSEVEKMDGYHHPRMLDLVSKERDWVYKPHGCGGSSEENKLELTLGPPGDNWSSLKQQQQRNTCKEAHDSLLSLGHGTINDHSGSATTKPWPSPAKFLQFPSNVAAQGLPVVGKESLQSRNNAAAAAAASENKGFSPSVATNTAVPNTSQKRTAPTPVVGWPPIRSFRKNLASSSTKPPSPESNKITNHGKNATEATPAYTPKGLFVKINMDGIPIGRKIDLSAYDSYENLSSAVDKLFRGLLVARTDVFTNGELSKLEEEKPITGLLDGSGEYTLIYEDNEGDRVLVGDVPWSMFVSTVKRLRVLKTSELRSLTLGSKQQKTQLDSLR